MRYISTRGAWANDPQPFRAILLEGLAPDGGLTVPARYPRFSPAEFEALRPLGYCDLATQVLSRFMTDIPETDLRALVEKTYQSSTFGGDDVTPLVTLEPRFSLLRASNGPTLSFKDVAMQLIGNLFEYVLADEGRSLNILGATSGDTGSAAEYAMRGKRGISVFMLSPRGRMSAFQQAQMYALNEPNIHNIAIDGTFDDCQALVKAVAGDTAFKAEWRIGAVNSINWARVAAQVVYYFKGYFAATSKPDEKVAFAVPSGNFGNIFAAWVARAMGVPIGQLILATNENDVLDEFFRTLAYRPRTAAETHATSSPSMDISKASNFERYIFDIVGRDPAVIRVLWADINDHGGFDLAETTYAERVRASGVVSGRSQHADRVATIREIESRYGIIIDPHTADGVKVGRELRAGDLPLICVETALPAKFATTIKEALGREPARPRSFVGIESSPQHVTTLPPDAARIKAFIAERALQS
ncbi:MAG TPA: threonine synthase [Casimicrobiaceae bacterium]|jgi:threonine synthase